MKAPSSLRSIFTLSAVALTLISCGTKNKSNNAGSNSTPATQTTASNTNAQASPAPTAAPTLFKLKITYAEVNRAIIQPNCIVCHQGESAKGSVRLENFADVKAYLDDVANDIRSGTMPTKEKLTPEQKQLFEAWVKQGATEFGNDSTSTTTSGTPTPTPLPSPDESSALVTIRSNYALNVKPLIERACMDCHNLNATPEGLGRLPIIRSIQKGHIKRATQLLDFSQTFPNWSLLSGNPLYYLTQIRGVLADRSMPPRYYRIPHQFDGKLLTAKETQTILDWVEQSIKSLNTIRSTPPTAQEFFANNCLGCHNSEIEEGGFSFQRKDSTLTIPSGNASDGTPYLTPRDPSKSAIYLMIVNRQMPIGGTTSNQEQQLIFDWIQQQH